MPRSQSCSSRWTRAAMQGQAKGESGAGPLAALDGDSRVVKLQDTLGDRQPQSRAVGILRRRIGASVVAVEDERKLGGVDAAAGIGDLDQHSAAVHEDTDPHLAF